METRINDNINLKRWDVSAQPCPIPAQVQICISNNIPFNLYKDKYLCVIT